MVINKKHLPWLTAEVEASVFGIVGGLYMGLRGTVTCLRTYHVVVNYDETLFAEVGMSEVRVPTAADNLRYRQLGEYGKS